MLIQSDLGALQFYWFYNVPIAELAMLSPKHTIREI